MTGGRFHFDPSHDPAVVPGVDTIRAWIAERMATKGSYAHMCAAAVTHVLEARPGWGARLAAVIPSVRRRRRLGIERRCLEAAHAAAVPMREVMLEFAVDLTGHPTMSSTFEAIAALGIMSITEEDTRRFVDHARANWDTLQDEVDEIESMLDRTDTEMRLAVYAAKIRAGLEMEAVTRIVTEENPAVDRSMRIAALRAALDEVRQVDLRAAIVRVLDQVGPGT